MKLCSLVKLWLLSLPREARALLLAISAAFTLLFFAWATALGSSAMNSAREIGRVEPQIARLMGYERVEDEFERALEQSALTLRALSYPRTEGSQAGAKLQQSLRGFAEDAGLIVNGSQLLVAEDLSDTEEEAFELLSVDLSLQGMPSALDAFLDEVRLNTPRLAVSKLDLVKPRRPRQRRGEPVHNPEILNVRMTVVGLREL